MLVHVRVHLIVLVLSWLGLGCDPVLGEDPVGDPPWPRAKDRLAMVRDQIEERGITDLGVLAAMKWVPRHEFVEASFFRDEYGDYPLPIGHGQTISQPYIVALMTEALGIEPCPHAPVRVRAGTAQRDRNAQSCPRVLEIGTGSGYQAAVLAQLTCQVHTMEIIPPLAEAVRPLFERVGLASIQARQGDGYLGWPEPAPYDALVVTAAASHIPPPLVQQLKPGGTMCIPVGNPNQVQRLMLVSKDEAGVVRSRELLLVQFVPLTRAD